MTQIFAPLKIGAGGFMIGLDLHTDGTKLCKSDVYGCWMWNAGTGIWDSLLTPARGFTTQAGDVAAYDMAAAPSNSSVIYIYLNDGNLYRSLDHGASFVQLTNFVNTPGAATNNGPVRFNGRRIAVDPINADVVYIGCPGDGGGTAPVLRVTSNGSQGTGSTPTFSTVASVTAPTGFTGGAPSGYNIAFDPNGGATSGKSNVVAVFSGGIGLYTTSAPLGAFTLSTGGPTSCSRLVCSQKAGAGSSIFYNANDTTTLFKFAAGTWSSLSPGLSCHSIAVDPADNTRLVAGSDGGVVSVSTNSGGGWTGLPSPNSIISPDIPWLAVTQEGYKSNGDMMFDPSASNFLMFAEGIGIFHISGLPNSGGFSWTSQSQGIENIITNSIVASPNMTNTVMTSNWDRFGYYSSNQDAYPASQAPNNLYSIQVCWDMNWATSDQKTLVGIAMNNTSFFDASATSSDNGQTWTFMPASAGSTRTVTTSGASSAGTNTLTIATQPFNIRLQFLVSNATHPSSIPAGTYVTGVSGATVTLSQNIASPGVSSGDTINIGVSASGVSQYLPLSANVLLGGTTMSFASAVPSNIKVGMFVNNVDNQGATNLGGASLAILSISGSTITLNTGVLQAMTAGDLMEFAWPSGGCVAVSSPSNFLMVPFPYPMVTADGGVSWNEIDIAGVPRPIAGTFASGSSTVTGSDTTNLIVGGVISTGLGGSVVNGCTVASITNSTTFVLSNAALQSITDVIYPVTGWGTANYLNHKLAWADRVTPNKFFLYNYQTGKVYVSTASGANGTWSVANTVTTNLIIATGFNLSGGQDMQFKAVPGNAGHAFGSNANVASNGNSNLVRTTDGNATTWFSVTGAQGAVTGVNAFGFGMPKPGGGGYPTVFIWGQVGGIKSTWRSDDNCATWIDLGTYNPNGTIDQIKNIDGDKNVYGRFYFSQGANGNGYGAILTASSNVVSFAMASAEW